MTSVCVVEVKVARESGGAELGRPEPSGLELLVQESADEALGHAVRQRAAGPRASVAARVDADHRPDGAAPVTTAVIRREASDANSLDVEPGERARGKAGGRAAGHERKTRLAVAE